MSGAPRRCRLNAEFILLGFTWRPLFWLFRLWFWISWPQQLRRPFQLFLLPQAEVTLPACLALESTVHASNLACDTDVRPLDPRLARRQALTVGTLLLLNFLTTRQSTPSLDGLWFRLIQRTLQLLSEQLAD